MVDKMELALLSNMDFIKFIDVSGLIPALFWLVFTFVVIHFSQKMMDRLGEQYTSYRLTIKRFSAFIQFVTLFVGFIFSLGRLLSINQDGMQFFIGLFAFGVSWASKDLLASLTAGITLLLDRPFQVGDRITFAGHYGEVLDIGLRSVRVVDLDDNVIAIPNNQFLQGAVSCANSGSLDQMCVFQFFIGCREDFALAKQIVQESVSASRYVFWDKPVVVHMKEGVVPNGAERFAILLTAKAYVLDGRYESAFSTDVHQRVKYAFREHGIVTAGEKEWQIQGQIS